MLKSTLVRAVSCLSATCQLSWSKTLLQWLRTAPGWPSAVFHLRSPRAPRAATVRSREKHVSFRTLGWAAACVVFRACGYSSLQTSVCWVYFFLLFHIIKSTAKNSLTTQEDFPFTVLVTLPLYFWRPNRVRKISSNSPLRGPRSYTWLHLVASFYSGRASVSSHCGESGGPARLGIRVTESHTEMSHEGSMLSENPAREIYF